MDDPVLIYLDETGDHSLTTIDKDFPLFTLTTILIRQSKYINDIVPRFYNFKHNAVGHEGIILHSRDIRKAQPPFDFLLNPNKRKKFLDELSSHIVASDFKILASVIKKDRLVKFYTYPYNPYDLALKFNLERILVLMKNINQEKIRIIAESRGKNEDDALRLSFYQIIDKGTERISKDVFKEFEFVLTFLPKNNNIIGTQLADLCGYPISRYILNPEKENKSYQLIKTKFITNIKNWSFFKVFP